MNELTKEELEMVTGAGWLRDAFDDIDYIAGHANRVYAKVIGAVSDMMCTATNNC